jgi:anti-anti-sigma factor
MDSVQPDPVPYEREREQRGARQRGERQRDRGPHDGGWLDVLEPGALVALSGRLDVAVAADVRGALAVQVERGSGELVLDLSGLDSLDPTGLGLLLGAHRRAGRAGRVLVLRDVTPAVARLLAITRLDRVLQQRRSEPITV